MSHTRSAPPTDSGSARSHILQVVPYFYPAWSYGGIPRLAYGLSRGLVAAGHRVTVLTTDVFDASSRLPAGERMLEGMRVLTMRNLSNRLAYHHQAFLPPALLNLERVLDLGLEAGGRPDIIHLHGHRHLLNNAAVLYAQRHGIPVVMTPNGTLPAIERKLGAKRAFDVLLGQRVLDAVSTFIAVSRAEVAQLRNAGIHANRINVIANGIDLEEFQPLPARGGFKARWQISGKMVLYLGKLTPRKGVDHLVQAMAQLPEGLATLVIAGNDMGVEGELRALVASLGLQARVHFVGLLTGEERLAALADADVLAYPSSHEIFGLVPFEGLLAGAPVVVGDDCGCGELVHAARAGVLTPYGNPRALALALQGLLEEPARGQQMVERGRRFIQSHLSWSHIIPKTVAVYEAVQRMQQERKVR